MATFRDGDNEWELVRRPTRSDDLLLAWNNADAYLLRELREQGLPEGAQRVLIANDRFGALGVALAASRPQWWSDSYRAWQALTDNAEENQRDLHHIVHVPGHETPEGPIDLAVLRFPKSLAWWEDQLLRLRPQLSPDALVVAGGMIKNTPKRAFELLESCIGPTKTSLGWKKARLAFSRVDPEMSCEPGLPAKEAAVPELRATLESRPNVFSWERLDQGTRMLLGALDRSPETLDILDVGCGNGVLAFAAAHNYPNATIVGCDESYQAIASAQANASRLGVDAARLSFVTTDTLNDAVPEGTDLVVCNPPFHQGHAVGDQLAWDLFVQARQVLRPRGKLLIVGNQHLRYHEKLGRLFGNCTVRASDPKFVVLQAAR